jgi:hypothetical protein
MVELYGREIPQRRGAWEPPYVTFRTLEGRGKWDGYDGCNWPEGFYTVSRDGTFSGAFRSTTARGCIGGLMCSAEARRVRRRRRGATGRSHPHRAGAPAPRCRRPVVAVYVPDPTGPGARVGKK